MSQKSTKRLRKFAEKMAVNTGHPVNTEAVKENYKKLNTGQKRRVMKDVRKALGIKSK